MAFTISRKLLTMVAVAVGMMAFVTFLGVSILADGLYRKAATSVEMQVQSALSIVAKFAALAEAGEMSLETAQREAKAVVSEIRFGDNDYFFVVDEDRIGLVHPNPDIIGRDLSSVSDQNGVVLFVELVEAAQRGGDFVPYAWPRAGSDIPIDKISYAQLFEPWGWVVATGVYLDDVRAAVREEAVTMVIWNIALIAALIAVSLLVARSISKPVESLRQSITSIQAGELDRETSATSNDEIGDISHMLDDLRKSLKAKARVEEEAAEKSRETHRVVEVVGVHLRRLSSGKMNVQIKEDFPDEYEALRQDFNTAVGNLERLYTALEDSASVVSANAGEIGHTTSHLAREAERNAAELNIASDALDRMTREIGEAASVADAADRIVSNARREATGSEEIIQATSEAMEKIKTSSNEIKNVTAVIEDIALQTSLLALNAGVEAARAGEAGRGFAIVAQEVRNLAVRCKDAVETINTLVAEAQSQAHEGASEFSKTREMIEGIIQSFNNIQQNVTEITNVTKSQAGGLNDLSQTMNTLLSMTQGNAASLEQNAASSQTLVDEARSLLEQLSEIGTRPEKEDWQAA